MNNMTNMSFDPNIHAELVYDGGDVVHVPSRLGMPAANQLQGTQLEQLAELAGRVCYDSLGRGRSSEEYHTHIREVNHLSVYEHCVVTVHIAPPSIEVPIYQLLSLFNRPGIHVRYFDGALRLTLNLRAALEFASRPGACTSMGDLDTVRASVLAAIAGHAPMVVGSEQYGSSWVSNVTNPHEPEEKWITLLLCGSRGMSHELVRHGDSTAISQRSTRYVDEAKSPWVQHPVETAWWKWLRPIAPRNFPSWYRALDTSIGTSTDGQGNPSYNVLEAVEAYAARVDVLEPFLANVAHVDKLTARKQARGAARGFLGNALYTELIFSASVTQWRHMLRMRCSDHADAEIRVLFARALGELKRSRYGTSFQDMTLRPATDGIGEVLA